MDKVYVLLIERSSTCSTTNTYIDSVYSSEQKAWERIEAKYKALIKTLYKHSVGQIDFAEFRGKRFVVSYYTSPYGIGVIKYIIDERAVH